MLLFGQEIVFGAREHIDNGVADAEDVVAKRGHGELDRLLWGRPALYLPFPPRQLRPMEAASIVPRSMSLARDVMTVGGATLLSRLLGFVRDVVIAAVLGAGALADAFFIALQIPNLFRRLLAEGALNSAFVPLWLRRQQEDGERAARRFSEDVLGTLGAALAAIAVLCALFAPALVALLAPGFAAEPYLYAVYFLRLADALSRHRRPGRGDGGDTERRRAGRRGRLRPGRVQRGDDRRRRAASRSAGLGNSPVVGAILAGAVVVAGIFQLLVVGGAMFRLPDPPIAPQLSASPDVRRFFRMMLPGVIAAGIPQLTLIAGTIVASSSPSAVSWLTYSYRLYELPLGVVSIAIASVMTPAIAAHVRADDRAASAARAIARLRDRARPRAAGGGRPGAAGRADRHRIVRARRVQRARHRRRRRRASRRSRSASPAMRWRRCWPRCRSRMRTPARRC